MFFFCLLMMWEFAPWSWYGSAPGKIPHDSVLEDVCSYEVQLCGYCMLGNRRHIVWYLCPFDAINIFVSCILLCGWPLGALLWKYHGMLWSNPFLACGESPVNRLYHLANRSSQPRGRIFLYLCSRIFLSDGPSSLLLGQNQKEAVELAPPSSNTVFDDGGASSTASFWVFPVSSSSSSWSLSTCITLMFASGCTRRMPSPVLMLSSNWVDRTFAGSDNVLISITFRENSCFIPHWSLQMK